MQTNNGMDITTSWIYIFKHQIIFLDLDSGMVQSISDVPNEVPNHSLFGRFSPFFLFIPFHNALIKFIKQSPFLLPFELYL